jgi:serine protease AprX
MRRSLGLSLALCLTLALSLPAPASAASSSGPRRTTAPVAALRDLNGNGLGDVLENRMHGKPLDTRFDVVVTTDGTVGVADSRRAVGAFRVLRRLPIVDGFSATVSGGQARALARMPGVERVEANVTVRATMDAARSDFGVDRAREDLGLTGAGVEACVLDTGADPNHEQLDSKTIVFQDFVSSAADPYDDHGHGTHVASILLGDGVGGPNAAKFGGVAPAASLVAGKVLDANGSGTTDDIVAAIEWCAARPSVDIISMSLGSIFGSDGTDALSQAVNAAVADGKVAVVAAGNSADAPYTIGSPGAAAGAITVGAAADWSAAPGASNHSDGVHLAYFSSRGPTLDGRTKPDVVAPGVTITAAEQGTAAGYVTYSGTSMATPFAAGAIALALQAEPGWTPAQVRSAIEDTAQDRGAPGMDNHWGAGLLDAYALGALAKGMPGEVTAFPAHTHVSASVADDGLWTYQFALGSGDLGVPIAATILVDGTCTFFFEGFGCLDSNWTPDLDARLTDPNGLVLDDSTCALGNECGIGVQETLHAMPTVAGTYTIRVFPFADSPNDGLGGSFEFDLSRGPAGSNPPPPPPPPTTMHVGDLDGEREQVAARRWLARVTIRVHDEADTSLEGVLVRARWNSSSTTVSCTTNANGVCRISKRWANSRAQVTFTVVSLAAAGLTYEAADNHDPDGDSTGTSISVARP